MMIPSIAKWIFLEDSMFREETEPRIKLIRGSCSLLFLLLACGSLFLRNPILLGFVGSVLVSLNLPVALEACRIRGLRGIDQGLRRVSVRTGRLKGQELLENANGVWNRGRRTEVGDAELIPGLRHLWIDF